MEHDEMVTEADAARRLGLSVSSLRAWRVRGHGPTYYKLGRAVRYSLADLDAYLAANNRRSTREPAPQPPARKSLRVAWGKD